MASTFLLSCEKVFPLAQLDCFIRWATPCTAPFKSLHSSHEFLIARCRELLCSFQRRTFTEMRQDEVKLPFIYLRLSDNWELLNSLTIIASSFASCTLLHDKIHLSVNETFWWSLMLFTLHRVARTWKDGVKLFTRGLLLTPGCLIQIRGWSTHGNVSCSKLKFLITWTWS